MGETISQEAFHDRLRAQGVGRSDIAFVCPMCRTVQSMRTLVTVGAGPTDAEVEKYIGFSCVGRFTNAGPPPREPPAEGTTGCNWTLGGLFKTHRLQVELPDGVHPTFEPASPAQAQALAARAGRLREATDA